MLENQGNSDIRGEERNKNADGADFTLSKGVQVLIGKTSLV